MGTNWTDRLRRERDERNRATPAVDEEAPALEERRDVPPTHPSQVPPPGPGGVWPPPQGV